MFKNKNKNMNNVYRKRIAELRLALNPKCSQRQLAEKLQLFARYLKFSLMIFLLWYKIKSLI